MDDRERSQARQSFAEKRKQFQEGIIAKDQNKTEMKNTEKSSERQSFAEIQRQFEQVAVAKEIRKTKSTETNTQSGGMNIKVSPSKFQQNFLTKQNKEDGSSLSSDFENVVVKPFVEINDDIQRRQQRNLNKPNIDSRSRWPGKKSNDSLSTTKIDIRSKYSDLAIFKSPHCLIKNDDNGKLSIERRVLEEIEKIEDTVNVIAIAGPYRTGKSYLLNRLAGVDKGFPLGHTTAAFTKGIWAWCLEHPKRQNEVLMLLDTEGIGDVSKGDEENDDSILCLATLLSGTFVFNMFGVLDEKSLKKLSFVARLSEKITLTHAEPADKQSPIPDIGFFLPSFVLCLRDFSLDMHNKETPDDYLEKSLQIKDRSGNEKKNEKYNFLRLSIIQYFKNRKCFIFDRPAARKTQLTHLERLSLEQLSEEFIQDTHRFLEYMYRCEPRHFMDDSRLNGRMFSSLVEHYIAALSSGQLTCIDEALTVMSRKENEVAVKTVVDMFQQEIESLGKPLPADFEFKYKIMQRFALQMMRKMGVLDDMQEFQRQAEIKTDAIKNQVVLENKTFLREACGKEMQTVYDIIIKPKVAKGEYFVQDGYEMYKDDFARLKEQVKQIYNTADSNLVQQFAIDFEERYQKQDLEIFSKTDMIRKEIKRKMEDKLEEEKLKLKEQVESQEKKDEAELKIYKEELSSEREDATKERKDKYEKQMLEWQEKEKELQLKLKESEELLKKFRENQNKKALVKPPVGETVMKTLFSLIPVVGPIATGVYERFSSK